MRLMVVGLLVSMLLGSGQLMSHASSAPLGSAAQAFSPSPGPSKAAKTQIKDWPKRFSPLYAGASILEQVRLRGGDGKADANRRYLFQRAAAGKNRSRWKTVRAGKSSAQGKVGVMFRAKVGKWKYRFVLPPAGSKPRVSTKPRLMSAVAAGRRPRDLEFSADGSFLRYAIGQVVYERAVGTGTTKAYPALPLGRRANGEMGVPVLSPDRSRVVFWSDATNLTGQPDTNRSSDLFVREVSSGTVKRIDTSAAGTQVPGSGSTLDEDVEFSLDGSQMAFVAGGHLYAYSVGGVVRRLTDRACGAVPGGFSSDGVTLFAHGINCVSGVSSGHTQVFAVDVTSGAKRVLTVDDEGEPRFPDDDVFVRGVIDDDTLLIQTLPCDLVFGCSTSDQATWHSLRVSTAQIRRSYPAASVEGRSANARWVVRERRKHAEAHDMMTGGSVSFANWSPELDQSIPLVVSDDGRTVAYSRGSASWTTSLDVIRATGQRRTYLGGHDPAFGSRGAMAYAVAGQVVIVP